MGRENHVQMKRGNLITTNASQDSAFPTQTVATKASVAKMKLTK